MDIEGFLTPTKETKEKCNLEEDEMWKPVGTYKQEDVSSPDPSLEDVEHLVKSPHAPFTQCSCFSITFSIGIFIAYSYQSGKTRSEKSTGSRRRG
jgi:hypothetical protein